jgi:hypothetical protein
MSSSLLSFFSDLYCYLLLSLNVQLFRAEILLHLLSQAFQLRGIRDPTAELAWGGTNGLDLNIALGLVAGCMSLFTIH